MSGAGVRFFPGRLPRGGRGGGGDFGVRSRRRGRPGAAAGVGLAGMLAAGAGGDVVAVQVCTWEIVRARARRVARIRERGLKA